MTAPEIGFSPTISVSQSRTEPHFLPIALDQLRIRAYHLRDYGSGASRNEIEKGSPA